MSTSTAERPPNLPDDTRPARGAARPPHSGRLRTWFAGATRLHYVVIALLAALVVAAVAWRSISVRSTRDAAAKDLQVVRAAAKAHGIQLLALTAQPLAWALRTELIANDATDVDAYLARLVQEPHVRRVAIIDLAGNVASASDQKLVGQPASVAFAGVIAAATAPAVVERGDDLVLVVPIMHLDRQLATLVLEYAGQSLDGDRAPWVASSAR